MVGIRTDEQKEALRLLNEAGWRDKKIARALSTDRNSVGIARRQLGVPKVRAFDLKRARELHATGLSDKKIAEVLGVTKSAICQWRKVENLPPTRPIQNVQKTDEEIATMERLLRRGVSAARVAKEVGACAITVQRYRSKMRQTNMRRPGHNDREKVRLIPEPDVLLDRLNSAVGEKVPAHVREHAVHDMLCDIYDHLLAVDKIEECAASYRSAAYDMCGSEYAHSRLDKPDENGLTLADTLTNDEWDPQEGW